MKTIRELTFGLLTLAIVIPATLILRSTWNDRPLQAQVVGVGNVISVAGRYPSDSGRSWSTYGAKTDTSNLQLAAAPGANQRVYIYSAFCTNVHASTAGVALIKYSTTTVASIECPPGSKSAPVFFYPPLGFPANTAVTMNSVGSVTTMHLFAQGTVAR